MPHPARTEHAQQAMAWVPHLALCVPLGLGAVAVPNCRIHCRAPTVESLQRNRLGIFGLALQLETPVGRADQRGKYGVARWQVKLRKRGSQTA